MSDNREVTLTEQADGHGPGRAGRKRQKRRKERHKAKQQPDAQPTYGKYRGYQT